MDPNACLIRLLDALSEDERDEACTALLDLYRWLRMGGFMPDDPRTAGTISRFESASRP